MNGRKGKKKKGVTEERDKGGHKVSGWKVKV